MSYLTKKSLFFIVLSVVCNPTFSDRLNERINECKNNVHKIFHGAMDRYFAFKFSMFSLSGSVIGSMETPAGLANHFQNNQNAILQYGIASLNAKHHELTGLFSFIVDHCETQNDEFTQIEKQDIFGYFLSLVKKIYNASPLFEPFPRPPPNSGDEIKSIAPLFDHLTQSPQKFCDGYNTLVVPLCRTSLAVMFSQEVGDLNKMSLKEAFMYCYYNYTHLDFTMDNTKFTNNPKLLQILSKSGESTPDEQLKFALNIMVNYFSHLMDVTYRIVLDFKRFSDLFPTVEEYCITAAQATYIKENIQ